MKESFLDLGLKQKALLLNCLNGAVDDRRVADLRCRLPIFDFAEENLLLGLVFFIFSNPKNFGVKPTPLPPSA